MKKTAIILLSSAILVSSCDTYTGSGAYAGGTLGSLIGSAIGGIAGGGRGADVGSLIGLAGGAALGAAAGSAAEKRQADREAAEVHQHYEQVQRNKARGINPYQDNSDTKVQVVPKEDTTQKQDDSGFDSTNSGDDRIDLNL